ncbi:hypothetical protein O4H51_05305 [Aeromonas hydrophila]|uniref:hypothetical protein n=1 Tax=Aeromonas hydrophila TaxID=644 RepID=UPI0022AEA29D|nr:hypothetical protein [Aeromonas hydrophila]ELB2790462.1 hypothetical protein [Aeromonas hydrophila]MCZ4332277.1 hypothetical protein [Aeromonas hydrophila]
MKIKREAAYHEAAHAVLASISKYHAIIGDINLLSYGAGEIYISLSRSKCATGGKPQDPSAQKDKEVARDFATVLCAGFVGEQIASERDSTLTPNPECAKKDHALIEQQLQIASLSKKYDLYQSQARELLEKHWDTVERVAMYLFANRSASPHQVATIIGAI